MGCSLKDLCLPEHTSRIDKIIFIRIPKTASTSIFDCVIKFFRNRYAPGCRWHIDYSTWRNWKTSDSFSFACVRNPFSEIRSRYLTYMSQEWPKILPVSRQLQDDPLSFTSYVRSCCIDTQTLIDSKSYHIISFNQIVTRSRFWQIFDENGMCQVDAIIRFERVSDGIKKIFCDYFGEDLKHLPALNVSTDRSSYKDHYTDETRELVESYYKNDLEMFGYDFSGSLDGEIFVNPKSVTISPFSWDDLVSGIYPLKINNDYQNGGRRVLGSDGRIIVLDTSRHPQTQWGNSPTDKLIENSQMGISLYPDKFKKKKISNTNAAYRARPDSKPISSPGPNYRWDGRKWVVA